MNSYSTWSSNRPKPGSVTGALVHAPLPKGLQAVFAQNTCVWGGVKGACVFCDRGGKTVVSRVAHVTLPAGILRQVEQVELDRRCLHGQQSRRATSHAAVQLLCSYAVVRGGERRSAMSVTGCMKVVPTDASYPPACVGTV
jgi:hypothetical protein